MDAECVFAFSPSCIQAFDLLQSRLEPGLSAKLLDCTKLLVTSSIKNNNDHSLVRCTICITRSDKVTED